jgi:Uma2 family endonuclease
VFPDGVSVIIDDQTIYEPDASVVCDSQIDLDATAIEKPLLVVEVTSPSSEKIDSSVKLADYLSLPSIAHVLIVDPVRKLVFHHARGDDADALTRILRDDDRIFLQPIGQWRHDLTLDLATFFDGA